AHRPGHRKDPAGMEPLARFPGPDVRRKSCLEENMMNPTYSGGRNIAMKVPTHQYDETVRFYRDVIGLAQIEGHEPAVGFHFGANQLWIDQAPGMSQAEIWLEIVMDDKDAAADHL